MRLRPYHSTAFQIQLAVVCRNRATARSEAVFGETSIALFLFSTLSSNGRNGRACARRGFPALLQGHAVSRLPLQWRRAEDTRPGDVRLLRSRRRGYPYHDSDAKNNGSGALNPADGTYLNEFRIKEGVDISYTKFKRDPPIDDTQYDKVMPPADLLYVGWTVPGEWFNLTVEVALAGVYTADLLYTSNRRGAISIDVNGAAATGPMTIPTTYDANDPVDWRQWHHWNVVPNLAKLHLAAGKNVLTIHIVEQGQMNLAVFNFKRAQ